MNRTDRRKFMKTFRGCPWATIKKLGKGEVTSALGDKLDKLADVVKQAHKENGIDDMYLFIDKNNIDDIVVIKRNVEEGYTKQDATGKIQIVPKGGKFDHVLGSDVNVDFVSFKREKNILLIGQYIETDKFIWVKLYDGQFWTSKCFDK